MALRPEDLALTDAELKEVDALEDALDRGLSKSPVPEKGQTIILVLGDYSSRVLHEIVNRYKKAGWSKVEHANGHIAFTP